MYEINEINQLADRLYYGENDRQYYAGRISSLAISAKFKVSEIESQNNSLKKKNNSLEQDNSQLSDKIDQLENQLLLARLQLLLKEEYAKAGTTQYDKEKAQELRTLISELKKYLNIVEADSKDVVKEASSKIEPYKIREEKERLAKERMDNFKASIKDFFGFGNSEEEKAKVRVKTK